MTPEDIVQLCGHARFGRKQKATSREGMAVSSHPVVSRVAIETLQAGGNAIDAALAASVAQTVVEPHMTTICGVMSVLYHDAATGEQHYVNGHMAAPIAGLEGLSAATMSTGAAVAVPGFWAAFEAAVERLGTKSKAELVAPAIQLARDGFPVYPFLYGMLFEQVNQIGKNPDTREMFMTHDGGLLNPGDTLYQHRLADTLEHLVDKGNDHFYQGPWAEKFIETVGGMGGNLTMEDMTAYEARWMEPARGTYRDFSVVASPPPENGGTHIIEILNLIEQLRAHRGGELGHYTEDADTLYWLIRFCAEVYTDGAKHGDPAYEHVPLDRILSKDYAAQRFDLMRMQDKMAEPSLQAYPGSTHLTVTDQQGNTATVLHSVMSLPWTNGAYVDGVQIWAGGAHFLRRKPPAGARGTTYSAPNMIFDAHGDLVLASGSPSVGLIQNIICNTLNILDHDMDIETSVHLPRFSGQTLESYYFPGAPSFYIETDIDPDLRQEVAKRGVALTEVGPWNFHSGSFEGIRHDPATGELTACADPRRAGRAEGVSTGS